MLPNFHVERETGRPMLVASKVGNLQSEFGHARPWVLELFAIYATDGQKQNLLRLSLRVGA